MDQPALGAAVDQIYEALSDDAAYRNLPALIANVCGSRGAGLFSGGTLLGYNSFISEFIADYQQHYYRHDLWADAVAALPCNQAYCLDDYVSPQEYARGVLYNEMVRGIGRGTGFDLFHCLAACLPLDEGNRCTIGLQRDRADGAFTASNREQLQALVPHLRRTLKLRDRLRTHDAGALALDALDLLDFGIVAATVTGAVQYANRCAEEILRTPDGGLCFKEGHLVARDPNDHERFASLIESAVRGIGTIGGAMPIADRKGRVTHFVFVARMPQQMAVSAAGRALIVIHSAAAHRGNEVSRYLRELFAFTAAEAGVAVHLLDGASIVEIGEHNDVAEKTIRTQVQSLLDKTQTSRQAELVSLLARALPRLHDRKRHPAP